MIELKRKDRESTGGLLRRFSKKVRQSGVLLNARKNRFHEKHISKRQKRVTALRRERLKSLRRKMLKTGEIGPREKIDLSKIRD